MSKNQRNEILALDSGSDVDIALDSLHICKKKVNPLLFLDQTSFLREISCLQKAVSSVWCGVPEGFVRSGTDIGIGRKPALRNKPILLVLCCVMSMTYFNIFSLSEFDTALLLPILQYVAHLLFR